MVVDYIIEVHYLSVVDENKRVEWVIEQLNVGLLFQVLITAV